MMKIVTMRHKIRKLPKRKKRRPQILLMIRAIIQCGYSGWSSKSTYKAYRKKISYRGLRLRRALRRIPLETLSMKLWTMRCQVFPQIRGKTLRKETLIYHSSFQGMIILAWCLALSHKASRQSQAQPVCKISAPFYWIKEKSIIGRHSWK